MSLYLDGKKYKIALKKYGKTETVDTTLVQKVENDKENEQREKKMNRRKI